MTLNEAIKHCEDVAKKCEFDTDFGMGNYFIDRSGVSEIIKRGEEYRQLAEWLRELRAVREVWTQLTETVIELRDNGGTGTQKDVSTFLVNYLGVLERDIMAHKTIAEEVNK